MPPPSVEGKAALTNDDREPRARTYRCLRCSRARPSRSACRRLRQRRVLPVTAAGAQDNDRRRRRRSVSRRRKVKSSESDLNSAASVARLGHSSKARTWLMPPKSRQARHAWLHCEQKKSSPADGSSSARDRAPKVNDSRRGAELPTLSHEGGRVTAGRSLSDDWRAKPSRSIVTRRALSPVGGKPSIPRRRTSSSSVAVAIGLLTRYEFASGRERAAQPKLRSILAGSDVPQLSLIAIADYRRAPPRLRQETF